MDNMNGIEWNVDAQGVGRIVLNRPEHNNALGPENAPAVVRAITEVLAQKPRVVVMEARGPIFCAGGDIREFVKAGDRLDELVDEILDELLPGFLQLAQATCPIVTVVGGPVGGAGVGLALCGDFVLASDTMKLRTGYAAIGLSPDVGASYFLARRVGAVRAQQWLMLSDAVDAQRCLVWMRARPSSSPTCWTSIRWPRPLRWWWTAPSPPLPSWMPQARSTHSSRPPPAANMTRCPWASGKSTASRVTRPSTTTPNCSGTPIRPMQRPRSPPAPTRA